MASPKKISLGSPFAQGEIPFPITHTFNDAAGTAINLTGWSESVKVSGPEETGTYGGGTVQITDAANGVVTYTFVVGDMTDIGKYEMLLWVTNGTNALASDLITWEVYDGPGTAGP